MPPDSSSSALAIDLVLEDAGSDHLTTLAFRHARITGGVWLHSAELPYRKNASGLKIGIQSQIAIDRDGSDAVDLADLADAYAARCLPNAPDQSSEPVSADWLDIVATVERRLGFVLEPELFSNMLFCAHLGGLEDPHIASTARELLSTFRRTDARGLYHFFVSLRFACDVDCTAVAVRGRLKLGDIDLRVLSGVAELRRITGRILGSAAVGHVDPRANRTHGKNNGELRRHVFKVYLDDHTVQGADLDRGLKNDAVVVLNALHPVLLELREGLRSPSESIPLREFVEGQAFARTANADIADIVAANLAYATGHLLSGAWREGTRYYASPEAFLFGFADLLAHFPEVGEIFPLAELLLDALEDRNPTERNSLDLAFAALTRRRLGDDPTVELTRLVDRQDDDGAWRDFSPLFQLGTAAPRMYFGSTAQTTAFAVLALTETHVDPPASAEGWLDEVLDRWRTLAE